MMIIILKILLFVFVSGKEGDKYISSLMFDIIINCWY